MVEEIKVTFQDKIKKANTRINSAYRRAFGGTTTKGRKSGEIAARKEEARLAEDVFNQESDIMQIREKGIGLTGKARTANIAEINRKRAVLAIDKQALKYTKQGLKAIDEEASLKASLTKQARSDLIAQGRDPKKNAALIKKSVNAQMRAAKKMKAAGQPINKNVLRTQKSITGQMREQQLLARHQQGATTRNAMNYLSIMFIGQALTKVFKGLYASATAAFQELTKGTTSASKGLTMLQANVKYVQFSLGTAISDSLLPMMDTIANWAEWLSDFISKNPKTFMWLIFGGIAVGTIMSIVGQVALLAASISNLMTNRAAMKAVDLMVQGINKADTNKMSVMTKLMTAIGGVVVAGVTIGIVIKMMEGKTSFTTRLLSVLTGVVGGAIAGAMIGSIIPGAGTMAGAVIGAAIGFALSVGINAVDYAKDTGMTSADVKKAIGEKIKQKNPFIATVEWTTNAFTFGVYGTVKTYLRAGEIATERGASFAESAAGQEKLIKAYDVIQTLRVQRATELGQSDYNQIGFDKVLRQQIADSLKNMPADENSNMFQMMGFGGLFDNNLGKKDVEQLQSQLKYIEGLTLFQNREQENADVQLAGVEAGASFADGYNTSLASIPTTITDISEDSIKTLNDGLETSNELIGTQSELLKTQATRAGETAAKVLSLAKAQERYNKALANKGESEESGLEGEEKNYSSIFDF